MAGNEAVVHIKGEGKNLDAALQKGTKSVEKFGAGIKKVMGVAMAAFAIKKIFAFAKAMLSAFVLQEQMEARLTSVVRASGEAAGWTAKQMIQYASELQKVTTFGDEVTISAMAIIATFKNIRGQEFADVTELAMDMATVMGGDLKGAAMVLGKALDDPATGLSRLSLKGIQFSESQRKVIMAMMETNDVAGAQQKIMDVLREKFGGAARDEAATFGGQMKQLSNNIGDLWESIGSLLVPVLEALNPLFEKVVSTVQSWIPTMKKAMENIVAVGQAVWDFLLPAFEWIYTTAVEYFVVMQMQSETLMKGLTAIFGVFSSDSMSIFGKLFGWLGKIVRWLKDLWINSYLIMMVAFENFGAAVTLVAASTTLFIISSWENVYHFFSTVLPALLDWVADNWSAVFTDLGNVVKTVFSNMWKNITNFFSNIWNWLTGKETDWEWTALKDGFEYTMKALPPIAARVRTEIEKSLDITIADAAEKIGTSFAEKRAEFDARVAAATGKSKEEQEEEFVIPQAEGGPKGEKKDGSEKEKEKEEKQAETFSAKLEGLTSLSKRITAAAASTPEKKIEDEVRKQGEAGVRASKEIVNAVDKDAEANQDAATEVRELRKDIKNVGALT